MLKKIKRNKKFLLKKRVIFFCAVFFVALAVPMGIYGAFSFVGMGKFISPIPKGMQGFVLSQQAVSLGTKAELEKLLKENNIHYTAIESASQSAVLIRLKSGEDVFFSTKKSYQFQISSLQLVLSRLTIEGKRFSRLDFRFDKPVVALR